jgi:hypothetical protein
MHRGLKLPSLVFLMLSITMPVVAQDGGTRELRDFWSINGGIAYAWDEAAFQDFESSDVAAYLSGSWGAGPGFFPDWMGVEAEIGLTVSDGRWLGERWSMHSAAAYLSTYTGSERLYFKLRGGLSSNRVDIGGFTGSDTGLAGGVGIGFLLFDQPLELHFTAVDRNVNTLTLHWRF